MNITEYKLKENDVFIYHGKADIIDVTFGIYNADESFYEFVGRKSGLSIVDLLHPEDVECFRDAVMHVDEELQRLLVRMMTDADNYRWVYMELSYNGVVLRGDRYLNVEITDVMAITDRYKYDSDLIKKYRRYMSLCNDIFMEYSYWDNVIRFYEYFNGHSRDIFRGELNEAVAKIRASEDFSDKQKKDFAAFANVVSKKSDGFKITIDAQAIADYMKGVQLECSCAAIYKDDMHYKMVGLCQKNGLTSIEQPYYLTEYAVDAATGVLNKKAIQEYARECIKRGTMKYFVILDIDDFKQINDRYGHLYGDEVIAKCAEIFRSVIQNRGTVGRFGGDEFMFVFEHIESEEELRRTMKTITKHAQWAYYEKAEMKVSFSSGIVRFPEDGSDYEELMKKADKCLYIAKNKGKNRYIIYREELHGAVETVGNTNRLVGLKASVSDEDKHILLSDMVLQLYRDGKSAIELIMDKVRSYYDIDAVSIYMGKNMKRTYSCGDYVNSIENFESIFEPEYQEFFDKNNYNNGELVARVEKRSATAQLFNSQQEIGKSIQFMVKENEEPVALVSFDFFNRSPKMGCLDNGMLITIGRLLAEVALKG